MVEVGSNSKIEVRWNVSPYDYSSDKSESIRLKMASKYGVRKDRVKVAPNFIDTMGDGDVVSDSQHIIQNINDPEFLMSLFADYIKMNNIDGADLSVIRKLDSEISALVDYKSYDKYRRYSIKWMKWSNFLSYGQDNFFDFTQLKKMVLLSGQPANQSGKTTLAIDLIRFLLFGKTTKVQTLEKVFNRFIPKATVAYVEGCIEVDGDEYIIKRTLTRPALEKRTAKSKTTQKVEYYKIVGSTKEELDDYVEDMVGENSAKTNKAIKEAIGRESDFELIMSVTESTLDDLVNKKDAERGRLLSRWIGLLPLEEKDAIAREKFNSEVKPNLMSNVYNTETLLTEIKSYEMATEVHKADIAKIEKENEALAKEIEAMEKTRSALAQAKQSIDESLLKLDITTLKEKMNRSAANGKTKVAELDAVNNRIKEIGDVDFSIEEYDKAVSDLANAERGLAVLMSQYNAAVKRREELKKGEICPTCGRKLDNVDNSALIKAADEEISLVLSAGKEKRAASNELKKMVESMKAKRDLYQELSKLTMSKSALELNVEILRNEYKDDLLLKKNYEKNAEAIDKNNKIEIELRNTEEVMSSKRVARETNLQTIASHTSELTFYADEIRKRKELVSVIKEEEVLIRNWKIYLELVGKNGISKMVLRKCLPIINAKLKQMLDDVCDFDIEVEINQKNEVAFNIIQDGVVSDLGSGSGFELTASALALRAVLSEMSTIPKCSGIILDEIFGRVSHENYENMKRLIEKISESNQYVWLISHNDEIKDWCDMNVVVKKEDNISKIVTMTRS